MVEACDVYNNSDAKRIESTNYKCEATDFVLTTTTLPPLPVTNISDIGCDSFYVIPEGTNPDIVYAVGVCHTSGTSSYLYECDADDDGKINQKLYTSTDCSSDSLS